MPNANFDTLLTTTLNNHRANLENNFATARPLVNWLFAKDRMRRTSGGAKIVEPLMHAQNSTAGSYSGYDTLSTTAQTGLTAAEYSWKQYATSIAINGLEEEVQNAGEAAVLDLLAAKIEQAEETCYEKFNVMLYGDGTGNSSKDFLGLKAIASTTVVLGNIDPAVDTWWKGTVKAVSAVRSDSDWTNAFNTASKGNIRADGGFTTQDLYEHYESSLAPSLRLQSNKEADARFEHLLFKGVPLWFDASCDAGFTYFLNSRYLKLVAHSKRWFMNTPFVRPFDKDARYAQILFAGNLVTSQRSRQAVITGQTV